MGTSKDILQDKIYDLEERWDLLKHYIKGLKQGKQDISPEGERACQQILDYMQKEEEREKNQTHQSEVD